MKNHTSVTIVTVKSQKHVKKKKESHLTSCVAVLVVSPPAASASASSTVFPENFFSQSSSDHTEGKAELKIKTKALNYRQGKNFYTLKII